MKLPHFPITILASFTLLAGMAIAHGGGYNPPPPDPPPGPPPPPPPPPPNPGGGVYHGPGDTAPGAPAPHGPSGSSPHTGSGGGSGSPKGPATGGDPNSRGPEGPHVASTGAIPGGATPNTSSGLDPTSWEYWWHFNKDAYLALKSHVQSGAPITHGDDPNGTVDRMGDAVLAIAVPALERALDREHDKDMITGAMIALARLAAGEVRVHVAEWTALFEHFEHDPNQEIAETSLVARGLLASEGAAQGLSDLMLNTPDGQKRIGGKSVPVRTRAFAAYALGLLGQRAPSEDLRRFVVHHLFQAVHSDVSAHDKKAANDVQTAAVISLGLVPLACSGAELSTKRGAPSDDLSREAEIEHLLALLRDRDQHISARAHVPESLARLCAGAPNAVRETVANVLVDELVDKREKDEVASGCVLALGCIGDSDRDPIDVTIRTALRRAADDVDVQTRCFALIAIAQTGGRAGTGEDPESGAREAQTFLLSRLTHGKVREREWSGLALGVLEHARIEGHAEASTLVRASLRDALIQAGSSDEAGALSIAEGLAGDRSCADVLLKKLERNADANTRGYVSVALGLVGAQEALGPLKKLLGESRYRPEILREVAIGLVLLGDPEVVPSLLKTLSESQGTAPLASAAAALGFIGDTRTLAPLAKLCESQQVPRSARAFAAVALGIVGDRERLPWHTAIASGINYRAITETLLDSSGAGLLDML